MGCVCIWLINPKLATFSSAKCEAFLTCPGRFEGTKGTVCLGAEKGNGRSAAKSPISTTDDATTWQNCLLHALVFSACLNVLVVRRRISA